MEKIKLWVYLHKEDLKVFFKNLIPISILILALANIPWIFQQFAFKNYDSETTGIVLHLEKIKGISDSQTGGRVVTKTFQVKYQYQVEEDTIKKKDNIHRSTINIKQYSKLNQLQKGDSILVGYDSDRPINSRIKTEKK